MTGGDAQEMPIAAEDDIVKVRQAVRTAAEGLGFGLTDVTRIVTAASELARNTLRYAGSGIMRWQALDVDGRVGIQIIFDDKGPGIPEVERAMEDGFSTSGGLGKGLPGAKRLMDEMEVQSVMGQGTVITLRKWAPR